MPPIRIQPVYAHDNFALAITTRFQSRANLLARLCFGIGRDRIFQVE